MTESEPIQSSLNINTTPMMNKRIKSIPSDDKSDEKRLAVEFSNKLVDHTDKDSNHETLVDKSDAIEQGNQKDSESIQNAWNPLVDQTPLAKPSFASFGFQSAKGAKVAPLSTESRSRANLLLGDIFMTDPQPLISVYTFMPRFDTL